MTVLSSKTATDPMTDALIEYSDNVTAELLGQFMQDGDASVAFQQQLATGISVLARQAALDRQDLEIHYRNIGSGAISLLKDLEAMGPDSQPVDTLLHFEAVVKGFCDLTEDVNAALAFHTALLLQLAEQRLRFRSTANRDGRFDMAYRKAEVLYSFVNTTMSFINR